MRASQLPIITLATAVIIAALALPASVQASGQATSSVVVTAQFSSRTTLKVSARVLDFDVPHTTGLATAVVDFSAGARTTAGSEVVLSVEQNRATSGPGGAADVETALTVTGEGHGTAALAPYAPATAGRWTGSGLRTGRLTFELRASAPGRYTVPLTFVLSAP